MLVNGTPRTEPAGGRLAQFRYSLIKIQQLLFPGLLNQEQLSMVGGKTMLDVVTSEGEGTGCVITEIGG